MVINNYLSIITLNINGLNAPIKRHGIVEWITKNDKHIFCLQETHLRTKDLHRLKVKGWKQIFQANRQGKKAGVAIVISDKIDFQRRAIKRDPESHLIYIQRKNPRRRHKHCKCTCTQHRSTQIHKENLGALQERY